MNFTNFKQSLLIRFINFRKHSPAILFYIILSLALFIPWLLKPNSVIMAIPGDPLGGIWGFWQANIALHNGQSPLFTSYISAPYGFNYGPETSYLWSALLWPTIFLTGEIFTYNFFYFISFPLAAITMYMLAWHVTRNRVASLVAGFIFSFSPYHLMRSLQHLTLANIQWLPLFFLSLIKFHEKRSSTNLFLLAGSFSLLFLFDYYYGYFTLIIAILMYCFIFIYGRLRLKYEPLQNSGRGNKKFAISIIAITSVSLAAAIFPIILNWIQLKALFGRSMNELYIFSARPLEYLTPSIDNPFFGPFIEKFASGRLHQSNFFEQTLYLGFTPLVLAGIAIYSFKKANKRTRFIIYISLTGALTALIFSAPPTVSLLGVTIPMPSYFAYKIVPVFRVYARFGIFVMLFVALLAGIGFQQLIDKFKSNWSKVLLITLTMLLITVEFINIPPWRYVSLESSAAPRVYRWLAMQQGDFIVVEYPWVSSAEYSNNEYLFYQRVHKKRLANGAAPGSSAERKRQKLVDLEDSDIGIRLRQLGVKYVIVHRDKYKEGVIPDKLKRYYGGASTGISQIEYNYGKVPVITSSSLKLAKRFNNDYVYKVQAPKGLVFNWSNNINSVEYFNGSKWRWMSNNGELLITNNATKSITASIAIEAFSFFKPRVLEVRQGTKLLQRGLVKVKPKKFIIKKVVIKPGINKIIFNAKPGAETADSRIHNDDKRKLSISFGKLSVKDN